MAAKLPVVCIFGVENLTLRSSADAPETETAELECHCFASDADLDNILIRYDPHVIVSIGREAHYPKLFAAPFEIRRRWLHFADLSNVDRIGAAAFNCYLAVCIDKRPEEPLVSIFTLAYRTGNLFARTFKSVCAQTYANWEWVIWDDSGDDNKTFQMLEGFARKDHRLRVIQGRKNIGVIGEVKYNACMATRGEILVELDHDDELTPNALSDVVTAARRYPDCGFLDSDFAEVGSNWSRCVTWTAGGMDMAATGRRNFAARRYMSLRRRT